MSDPSLPPLAEWKTADPSYLEHVHTASYQHPSLKLLKTLPTIPEHASRIKILEFSDSTIDNVDIYQLTQLEAYWESRAIACKGRLYLIEDISLPWISLLGNHFDIDPRFFAEYLKLDLDRTQNFLEGYHTMRRLHSLRDKTTFATFVYHEIRTFDGCAPRREEYEILTRDNVTRLVTTVDHHSDRSTGLIRRNLGVWWRYRDGAEDTWDAIILIDPGVSDTFSLRRWMSSQWSTTKCRNTPYLDGYLDFSPWPTLNDARVVGSGTMRTGILNDISYYWRHASSSDLKSALHDPRYAAIFAYRIMASHWNLQLEYLVSVVSDLEKGLLRFEQMDAHPRAETIQNEVGTLRTLLSDVNSWRRRVYFYLEQMKWNVEELGLPDTGNVSIDATARHEYTEADENYAALHQGRYMLSRTMSSAALMTASDFASSASSLRLTQQRIQSLLPVVMGAFSLLEAQHSVLKADLTIRLSSVALVFVPLSFAASLLSMSGPFQPGEHLFWVYFAISCPLILGLFWWAYWVQLGRAKRAGKRAFGERFSEKFALRPK